MQANGKHATERYDNDGDTATVKWSRPKLFYTIDVPDVFSGIYPQNEYFPKFGGAAT